MRILGIDPGVAITGWGIIDQDVHSSSELNFVDYGVIRTSKDIDQKDRLLIIFDDLSQILNKYKPDIIAIEKLYFCTNVRTAITVGEARGVVLLVASKYKLSLFEYTPLQIKDSVCGYGKADKKQVQSMVANILQLEDIPKPDDAADGLAVAICCSSAYRFEDKINSDCIKT